MRILATILICLLALPGVSAAQDWISQGEQPDRAYYRAMSGDRGMQIGCMKGERNLGFVLFGGGTPLFQGNPADVRFIIWIVHPDGRVARVPGDAEYLAGTENALIGRLLLGEVDKEFFTHAVSLAFVSGNDLLFETGMRGSAAALSAMLKICPNA